MSSAVAQSRNGVLVDLEVVLVAVTTQKLLLLVLLATVLPLVLEASAVVVAGSAGASEEVSVAEEEEAAETSGVALVEVTEVGMGAAGLESATAMAFQKVPHLVLVVPEAVVTATQEAAMVAAMVAATATPAEAQDTATGRHATATVAAEATENPLEVETVVVVTATVIGTVTTTASVPTMETVATTNRASKEGTERLSGLLKHSLHARTERFRSQMLKDIDGKPTTVCAQRR
jgi:hypothetical protein